MTITIVTASAGQSKAAECDAPKSDFQISAPDASVGPSAAVFSGVWIGTWTVQVHVGNRRGNALRCEALHVSVRDSQSAAIADCLGSLPELGYGPQCDKYVGSIKGNELSFVTVAGSTFTLKAAGSSTLLAQSVTRQNKTYATDLHREQ